MEEGTSLINIGELSKPATVLIEKISEAVGGLFLPWQMRRVAHAAADVAKVEVEARLEISNLERRAVQRWLAEEGIKQKNIEDIIQKALPTLDEDAHPENVENDWIANFFDKCRLISDQEMQELWARVLAGEANAPGKFSKRTVHLLASFDKADAELFQSLCSFCWKVGPSLESIILKNDDFVYTSRGVTFDALLHLETMGVISLDTSGKGLTVGDLIEPVLTTYIDEFLIEFLNPANKVLRIGSAALTRPGRELASVCEAQKSADFQDYVLKSWTFTGVNGGIRLAKLESSAKGFSTN
jgi:hypothetical protein